MQKFVDGLPILTQAPQLKPHTRSFAIIGGVFGVGKYRLVSLLNPGATLHEVSYFVAIECCDADMAFGVTKAEALGNARAALAQLSAAGLLTRFEIACAMRGAGLQAKRAIERASTSEEVPAPAAPFRKRAPGPTRKRRRLFDAAAGKCFYCACELQVDGDWHVDHRLPRALGGDNSPENLAVACAACNLSKGDKTDVEFLAQMARRIEAMGSGGGGA